jgi:hypothetical protein
MSSDGLFDNRILTEEQAAELDIFRRSCPWPEKDSMGIHRFVITGTPRSPMTYRECLGCGLRVERGMGLFYQPE